MTKDAFLQQLRTGVAKLPPNELEERIAFYNEMIDDRMEEGLSEEEAVAQCGSVEEIVAQILSEMPTESVKESDQPKRPLKGGEIALIIIGSPIWFPILLALILVAISLYISVWAVIASLWAVVLSLGLCALQGLFSCFFLMPVGAMWQSMAMLGIALASAGLSVLLFFGCTAISKGCVRLTKQAVVGIKHLWCRKKGLK